MARELKSTKSLKELAEMETDLERLMDAFLYGKPASENDGKPRHHPVDVLETREEIVIMAEIPGLEPGDFEVSLSGSALTIEGKIEEERAGERENSHLRERVYGPFIRTINLPKQVQTDTVRASYENGVLTVTISKVNRTKKKRVKTRPK